MRTMPGKMRTDEQVYVAAFDSITFINIGVSASKRGTRWCAAARRVLDVAIRGAGVGRRRRSRDGSGY